MRKHLYIFPHYSEQMKEGDREQPSPISLAIVNDI